jgi:ABC-type bacteriocin/lantibiotic exporter with double-glycine peptidase domain
LQDLTLSVDAGTTVAIVGPNGSGKSTIAYLILGFYRPQAGEVYADNHPFRELDIKALRRDIGIVTQTQMMFSGTILENITYGHPDCSFSQVARAARIATAHDFIQKLPHGYETSVGERGVRLSGGERQRIAIARALIAEPRLLILDEPTVHLDRDAIGQLMRNLASLVNSPTTILISHDISVVQEADRAYVLKDGRISASPEPATLLYPSTTALGSG